MKIYFIISVLLFLPFLTKAHAYWLELDGTGKVGAEVKVKIYFGEYENNLREQGSRLAGMKDFRAYVIDPSGKQLAISLVQTQTCWEGRFTPTEAGHYQVLGVNDTREVQDLTSHGLGILRPIEYLRSSYIAEGRSSAHVAKPHSDLDILARHEASQLVVNVYSHQQPLAKVKLTVLNPQGWKKSLTTGVDGTARFSPTGPGLYIVEAELSDKTPGQYKGKDYPVVRTKSALSVLVD